MWRKCTIKNILSTQNFVFCESFFPTSSLSLKREDFVMALRRVCAPPARSGGPAGRGRPLALTVHVLLLLTAVGPGVHRAAPGVPSPGPHHEAAVRQTGAEDSALGGHLDGRTQ